MMIRCESFEDLSLGRKRLGISKGIIGSQCQSSIPSAILEQIYLMMIKQLIISVIAFVLEWRTHRLGNHLIDQRQARTFEGCTRKEVTISLRLLPFV
jgi:hypothetical protein